MHKIAKLIHNLRGQICGPMWGELESYPHLSKTMPAFHLLFTNPSHAYSQTMWIIPTGSTGVNLGFTHNPQALLLLHTSFKKIKAVVKTLFGKETSTIMVGEGRSL